MNQRDLDRMFDTTPCASPYESTTTIINHYRYRMTYRAYLRPLLDQPCSLSNLVCTSTWIRSLCLSIRGSRAAFASSMSLALTASPIDTKTVRQLQPACSPTANTLPGHKLQLGFLSQSSHHSHSHGTTQSTRLHDRNRSTSENTT
jgi:hypothetical protein